MLLGEEEYKNIVDKTVILCVDALIVNEEGKYLLVKRKNEPLKGQWWVVGGRMFKGETAKEAIVRKVKEETNLDVEVSEQLGYYEEHFKENPFNLKSGIHTISIAFLVKVVEGTIKLDEQSSEYKWAEEPPEAFSVNVFG